MADLVTTLSESVVLNNAVRGSSNSITTTGIVDVYERILTCAHSQTTTVVMFATTPHTEAGALDVENTKYIRITNLSEDVELEVAFVGTATLYQVRVRALGSHILFNGDDILKGEADTTPAFGITEELVNIQVRPIGTTDAQVEVFVGLV
mgnify:CR=1 FL=1|tara:strand:+ start:1178 stop:1627 length:450 start_codon:yes stop_codon:yes gene_type:complete